MRKEPEGGRGATAWPNGVPTAPCPVAGAGGHAWLPWGAAGWPGWQLQCPRAVVQEAEEESRSVVLQLGGAGEDFRLNPRFLCVGLSAHPWS